MTHYAKRQVFMAKRGLTTAELAMTLGKATRTVRRYAQFGMLTAVKRVVNGAPGWHFIVSVR